MYTLRTIRDDGTEQNFYLGKFYSLLLKERMPEKEWVNLCETHFGEAYNENVDKKEINTYNTCKAIVESEDGTRHHILYYHRNYIMTEGGKTFSNLSYVNP